MLERAGRLGHLNRLVKVAERIANEPHGQRLSRRPAGRIDSERTPVGADVDAVGMVRGHEDRPLHLDERRTVSRQLDRQQRILDVQRVVVVGGQFAALLVEDPHRNVERRVAKPLVGVADRVHLDRQPLAGDRRHLVEIDVPGRAVAHPPADRHVGRDGHRRRERVIGIGRLFVFVNDRKGRDVERRHGRQLLGRPHAEGKLSQRTVGRDLEPARERALVVFRCLGLDVHCPDAGPVEDHLLRVFQAVAPHRHSDLRASLAAAGFDRVDVVVVGDVLGDGDGSHPDRHAHHTEHRDTQTGEPVSRPERQTP